MVGWLVSWLVDRLVSWLLSVGLRASVCVCVGVCMCYGRLRALPCVWCYGRLSSRLLFLDRSRLGRLLFVVTNWPQQSSSTAGTAVESTVVFSGYVG